MKRQAPSRTPVRLWVAFAIAVLGLGVLLGRIGLRPAALYTLLLVALWWGLR